MTKGLTVLYYSASTENEKFEEAVRQNILVQKGDLPLISVTQKPLPNFGQNICVGPQYNCYGNEFRQIQLGLKEVKTESTFRLFHKEPIIIVMPMSGSTMFWTQVKKIRPTLNFTPMGLR